MGWSLKCPDQRLTKSEPWGTVCTAFIENFSGVCMCDTRTGADPPIARWSQMAALGAAICNMLNELWNGVTSVSKPCRAWRPSLSDQAGGGGYPKTVTHILQVTLTLIWGMISSALRRTEGSGFERRCFSAMTSSSAMNGRTISSISVHLLRTTG